MRDGQIVALKPKAYDMLCVLLANRGRVVGKPELLDWLWPRQDVAEANLSQTVYELRRALGGTAQTVGWIENVPRRGYRFAGKVVEVDELDRTGPPRSIAVLPFRALNDDAACREVGLGIANAVIVALSGTGRVVVRSLSAVMSPTAAGRDALAIGRELEVDAVLEGSAQYVGEQLAISARLIRVPGGENLWADRRYENPADLRSVYDRIAYEVAQAVALRLNAEERRRMARPDDNSEVQALHLKGRYCWHRWTPEASRQAVEFLEAALAIDPRHAPSCAWLGAAWSTQVIMGAVAPREGFTNARQAIDRAVALDDALPVAYEMRGAVELFFDWNLAAAARSLDRAIELDPDSSNARHLRALVLAHGGYKQPAQAEMQRALQADPSSLIANTDMGVIHYWGRRFDQARIWLEGALRQDPRFAHARSYLAYALLELDCNDAAVAEMEEAADLLGRSDAALGGLAYVHARAGRDVEARGLIAELQKRFQPKSSDPYQIALGYLGMADWTQALSWLEKALEHRSRDLVTAGVSPIFDPLRQDSRFVELMRKGGLRATLEIVDGKIGTS